VWGGFYWFRFGGFAIWVSIVAGFGVLAVVVGRVLGSPFLFGCLLWFHLVLEQHRVLNGCGW